MKQERLLREQLQHKFGELPVEGQPAKDWQQLKKALNVAIPVSVFFVLLHGKIGLANKLLWLYLLGLGAAGSAVLMVCYPPQPGANKASAIKHKTVITKKDTTVHKHKTLPPVPPQNTIARKRKTMPTPTAKDSTAHRRKELLPVSQKDSSIRKQKTLPPVAPKDTALHKYKKLPPPYAPKDSAFRGRKSPPPPIRDTALRKHKKARPVIK